MRYEGYAFRQVQDGPILFLFIATTADIDRWAKVPTKMSQRPQGFQRAENRGHTEEIKSFFREGENENSSPTTVILGIEPEHITRASLRSIKDESLVAPTQISTTPTHCLLYLDYVPWDSGSFDRLEDEVITLWPKVQHIYEQTLAATDSSDDDAEDPESLASHEDASSAEFGSADEDESESEEDSGEESGDPDELLVAQDEFIHLTPSDIYRAVVTESFLSWDITKLRRLRDLLKDDLKIGLIIDGQHRVKATSDIAEIPFAACLLPFASWGELAFQFIVNNSTAKKVADGLLISIVGDSLSPDDLAATEVRLNRAGIRVSLIQAVMRVHKEDNPFCGMLKFDFPGEHGFLEAPAMQKKVVELWWGTRGRNGLRPAFKTLTTVKNRTHWDLAILFGNVCRGTTRIAKARDWQERVWFDYFKAFWEAVADHFRDRLWPATRDQWLPSSSTKWNYEQRERQRLMRATVLGLLQRALLQVWADNHNRKTFGDLATFKITPHRLRTEISQYVKLIPPDFFTELAYTGFDASADLREDLLSQFLILLEMNKKFPEIRTTHRFWQSGGR